MTSEIGRPFVYDKYTEVDGEKYIYLNDDNPLIAYTYHDISFVAQPIYGPEQNKRARVVPVPLMMTDEWPRLIENEDLCRLPPPSYEFGFIGQANYAGRQVLAHLDLENYLFEDTNPIYNLPTEEKREKIKAYLLATSACEFTFCPRGIGSSSFRLYQAFMVGSIPIVTGMNDYPFSNVVDWDKMCIRGELKILPQLIRKAKEMSTGQRLAMSAEGRMFWESYCKHDELYRHIQEIVRNHEKGLPV